MLVVGTKKSLERIKHQPHAPESNLLWKNKDLPWLNHDYHLAESVIDTLTLLGVGFIGTKVLSEAARHKRGSCN
jgi:hypothetical protein